MTLDPRTISHIFNLDSIEGFERAEAFKAQLENDGFIVSVFPFGFNSVRIVGVER